MYTRAEDRPLFQHLDGRRRSETTLRGFVVSALVHLALIVATVFAGGRGYAFLDEGSPGGIRPGAAGGGGGGGGGEQVTYIDIAPAAPPAPEVPAEEALVVTEPEPVVTPPPPPTPPAPVAEAPKPTTTPPTAPQPTATAGSGGPGSGPGSGGGSGTGAGGGSGEGQGTGTGPGSGSGSGGGHGSGVGTGIGSGTGEGKMTPPVPEMILLPPPKPPASIRGQTLVVRVSIDTSGEVRDVEFRSTGDRGYDSRLRKVARDWRFRPARDPSGKPVAVQFDVTLGF